MPVISPGVPLLMSGARPLEMSWVATTGNGMRDIMESPPRAVTTGLRMFCRTKPKSCYLPIGSVASLSSGAPRERVRALAGSNSIVCERSITVCAAAENPAGPCPCQK